jgi:hypothetical protein
LDSTPRAYRLKASNAYLTFSTSAGTSPTNFDLAANWPTTFADGTPQTIQVAGKPVQVTFEKIGNIP